jgi:hypothetical protein
MNTANSFRNEPAYTAPRAKRAFFEDWMLQLVLVIAVVAALVDCALSLNGSSLV